VPKFHTKVPPLRVRLYVAGNAPNSVRAIASLRAVCDEHFASGHEIEIVDMLVKPLEALADGIIVTPTLLKLSPPAQRMVGNLGNASQLLEMLAAK